MRALYKQPESIRRHYCCFSMEKVMLQISVLRVLSYFIIVNTVQLFDNLFYFLF